MGTRHIIAVVKDNDYKVAQYGQWDGYLDGQGQDIVEFLRDRFDRKKFEAQLAKLYWITDEEIQKIQSTGKWEKGYPYLKRSCSVDILDHIQDGDIKVGLQNEIAFAGDGLYCEWAYVINLDTDELEIYKGFSESPPKKGERFAKLPKEKYCKGIPQYYPVCHFHTFKFSELADYEDFVKQWTDDANNEDG